MTSSFTNFVVEQSCQLKFEIFKQNQQVVQVVELLC